MDSESMITKAWMEQLGVEDGSSLAGRVLAMTQEEASTEQICERAVAAMRECASLYRERGVSDSLVAAWRIACLDEISRRFAEYRGWAPAADSDASTDNWSADHPVRSDQDNDLPRTSDEQMSDEPEFALQAEAV